MSVLRQLIGCWKITRFVHRDDYSKAAYATKKPPPSLQGLLRRNEVVFLLKTDYPLILEGRYNTRKDVFYIKCNRRGNQSEIVLKCTGELKFGGSYQLAEQTSQGLVWKSLRRHECKHAIKWTRCNEARYTSIFEKLTGGQVPLTLVSQTRAGGNGQRCACGRSDCQSRTEEEPLFVTITQPPPNKRQQQQQQQQQHQAKKKRLSARDRRRVKDANFRAQAHWEAFHSVTTDAITTTKKGQKSMTVCTCHMHPFAQEKWKSLSKKSRRFKSFVISAGEVDGGVMAADREKFYLLVKERRVYMPKLNYFGNAAPSPSLLTSPIAVAEIEKLQKSNQNLRQQNVDLVGLVSSLQTKLDGARAKERPRYRGFFTKEFHQSNNKQCHTLKSFFGLTDVFQPMTDFVLGLFYDYADNGLEERHSADEEREAMTPFERCLLAKA